MTRAPFGRPSVMSAAERVERKPAWWTLIFLAVVLIAAGASWLLLPLREWLGLFERWITGLGAWGVALFALIYILATISLAPEWPLTIAAGLLYGAWGFPITLVTATSAASLAFLIARHFGRDKVRSLLERRRIFSAIDDAVAEEGWKVVALLRLSPAVPFNLQNYLFGVTAVSFHHFVGATFAGIIPGTVLYVYLGILGRAAASGAASGGPLKWLFFGIGLLATLVFVILVTRKALAKLKRIGIDDRNP
jgi:uncharacterized membrane protein YdjX (TVP38/TMEM64 family)